MSERVVLSFVSNEGQRATHVRSTLISASLETLRVFDAYEQLAEALPATYHTTILYTFAPTWLPIDVVTTYYDTWENLDLTPEVFAKMGEHVSVRIQGSVLGTLLRNARGVGVNPWIPLHQLDKLWSRVFLGGSVHVTQRGPKEAVIELAGLPMLRGRNFRMSCCALLRAASHVFARTTYVRELTTRDPERIVLLSSWV